jgi:tRNA U34 5-methylaminomethyl-2-thiouridine-forming methyltransferase MnmC
MDGSSSVFDTGLNEHFHSVHGAIQESAHIFIRAGLYNALEKFADLNILEVGFGTGLNALMTIADPMLTGRNINYVALEPIPLREEIAADLNYTNYTEYARFRKEFLKMHKQPANIPAFLSPLFLFSRMEVKLEDMQFKTEDFNLVFFDAFSPQVQPELWTTEIFSVIYRSMQTGGILVTYSCKGSVKRALKLAGFRVEQIAGPPGKREITRAFRE